MRIGISAGLRSADAVAFEVALQAQSARLGLSVSFDRQAPFSVPTHGRLAVIFLDPSSAVATDPPLDAAIRAFLDNEGTVLPIARSADEAGRCVKGSSLGAVNALLEDAHGNGNEWIDAAVDETLAQQWVRRRRKRVFVSYKRSDATDMARQLFDAFSARGFEVFLDEASIAPASNFQERLKWWLNDADLLILLASPRLDESNWVLEEIEFAKNHRIGVLAVEWPNSVYDGTESFDGELRQRSQPTKVCGLFPYQRYRLPRADLADTPGQILGEATRLTDAGLDRLIARARRNRTLSLRERLNDLIRFTDAHFSSKNIPATHNTLGDFRYDHDGLAHLLRVLPFRPDHGVCHELARAAAEVDVAGCLYTESSPEESDVVALLWCLEATRTLNGRAAQIPLKLWHQPRGPLP